jgi:cytochrome P450 family 142 subfamily A polypeptide 1
VDVDVDYLAASSWDESMHDRMHWLRRNAPVYWAEKSQVWVLSKFEDVLHVSKNPRIFCSGQGVRPGIPVRQGLIDEDDPRHSQLRRLINRGFTPRMVGKLEGAFREISRETLDAIADRGECDFVDDVAVPLPLLLIAEMIGIRREDRMDFHRWSDAMMAGDGNFDDPEVMQKATQAFIEYSTYVTGIIEDRRRHPRDDLVSILANAKDEGILERFEIARTDVAGVEEEEYLDLANDELVMLLVILMVAGNETTRNALSGSMALLIEHPAARQTLIDDPTRIPDAVEEMLRFVSPVQSFARTVTRDTKIRDQEIREGEKVLMLYPSANRDEDVFEDPDAFRIDRKPHHLAFGIGPHFCLGANLARMELRVALEELLRRFPDMEYSRGGPEIRPAALVRSCVHLWVRYTPESR